MITRTRKPSRPATTLAVAEIHYHLYDDTDIARYSLQRDGAQSSTQCPGDTRMPRLCRYWDITIRCHEALDESQIIDRYHIEDAAFRVDCRGCGVIIADLFRMIVASNDRIGMVCFSAVFIDDSEGARARVQPRDRRVVLVFAVSFYPIRKSSLLLSVYF